MESKLFDKSQKVKIISSDTVNSFEARQTGMDTQGIE